MMKSLLLLLFVFRASAFLPVLQNPSSTRSRAILELQQQSVKDQHEGLGSLMKQSMIALGFLLLTSCSSFAADYAGSDLSGQDLSGSNYAGKDFTSVNGKGTNFHNANLQGCIFSKSNLRNADFSGADIRGAHFEDAVLDGVSFKDANAERAFFSATILDVADMENIDLSESIWPSKLQIMLCDMPELKGTNVMTGVDSRRSILCRS